VFVDEAKCRLVCTGANGNTWWADASTCGGGKRLLHNAIFERVIRKYNNAPTHAQSGNRGGECGAQSGKLIVDGNA
jgi:hypothetical protein